MRGTPRDDGTRRRVRTGGLHGTTWHNWLGKANSEEISGKMRVQTTHRMGADDLDGALGVRCVVLFIVRRLLLCAVASWCSALTKVFYSVLPLSFSSSLLGHLRTDQHERHIDHIYVTRSAADRGGVRVVSARVVTARGYG